MEIRSNNAPQGSFVQHNDVVQAQRSVDGTDGQIREIVPFGEITSLSTRCLGGTLGAVVAAVPGFIDWLSLKDPAVVKIANWHARLNVIALVVFAVSFYLRTTGGAGWVSGSYTIPVLLSVFGVILIAISSWLGGELVFRHGVAVDQQSGPTGGSQK